VTGEAAGFTLFGRAHIVTMALIASVAVAFPLWIRSRKSPPLESRVARALAVLLVALELGKIWLDTRVYGIPLAHRLPLHLCGVAIFLTAVVLVRRTRLLYEIIYFWGLGGAVQAVLTPELHIGFPDPRFVSFFLTHGLIIIGVLYATVVFRLRPTHGSIGRAFLATLVYAALVTPVNVALGTNYLYLMRKPERASLIDHLGPWPWYIPALGVVALVSFYVYYLPFAIADLRKFRMRRRAGQPSRHG
jgi:hypothetical integral membrane protein (TIGR02206 family)